MDAHLARVAGVSMQETDASPGASRFLGEDNSESPRLLPVGVSTVQKAPLVPGERKIIVTVEGSI